MIRAGLRVAVIATVLTISVGGFGTPCLAQTKPIDAAETQTVDTLLSAAERLDGHGQYATSEPLCRRALAGLQNLAEPTEDDTYQTVRALWDLAGNIENQNRYAEAEALDLQALAVREKRHLDEQISEALSHLAKNIRAQGRYPEAEMLVRRALALIHEAYGSGDPSTLAMEAYLDRILVDLGRSAEAEPLLKKVLAAWPKKMAPTDSQWHLALDDLGVAIRAQGRYAEAETFFRQVLDFEKTSAVDDQTDTADSLSLLPVALSHLAADLEAQGESRYGEAEPLFRQALALHLQALGPSHPTTRRDFRDLGELLDLKGEHAAAVVALRNACGDSTPGGPRGGQTDGAGSEDQTCSRELASALLGWAGQGGGHLSTDSPEALKQEAFLQAQRASVSAAGVAMARSSALTAARRDGVGDDAAELEAKWLADDALDANVVRAAAGSESDRTIGPARKIDTHVDVTEDQVRSANVRLSEYRQMATDRRANDAAIARLTAQLKARSPQYWDFRSPQPTPAGALQGGAGAPALLRPDEAVVLWMIPPGTDKGLVFAVSREAFAWARIGLAGDEIKAKVDQLRRQIDPHAYAQTPDRGLARVQATPDRAGEGFDRATAYALYRALLGNPDIDAVIAPRQVLLIAPSGPMWSLPPGLLVTRRPEGGDADPAALRATPWLLRDKAVALLPAVSSLRTLRQLLAKDRPVPTDRLLALADPDFGNRAAPEAGATTSPRGMDYYVRGATVLNGVLDLPRLPGTRVEAWALASALGAPRASVLTDADASKAQLMARNADGRLSRVKVLEFATHGLVTGDAGLAQPALALAKGGKPADELLLASEVTGLKINADWTLLSACNTASPDAPEAQGLSGLSRAFFFAGAVSVVVSHWRVDDKVTATLIPDTLKRQANDPRLGRAEALRQASLAILDDPAGRHALPSYWAPFTLIGEAGPVAGR